MRRLDFKKIDKFYKYFLFIEYISLIRHQIQTQAFLTEKQKYMEIKKIYHELHLILKPLHVLKTKTKTNPWKQ